MYQYINVWSTEVPRRNSGLFSWGFLNVLVVVAACKQEICMLSIDVYEKNTCYWSDIYSTSSIISFPFRRTILEASDASIISNKYVRDDANVGHRVGPSNGMQVYLLCFHRMTKQSLISKTSVSLLKWLLCCRWPAYLPLHTSTTAGCVMNRLYKRLRGLQGGKAKVSFRQWTVQRLNLGGSEIFHTHPKQALDPTQPFVKWTPDLLPGRKLAGALCLPSTPI
jgi:hypothetical protein